MIFLRFIFLSLFSARFSNTNARCSLSRLLKVVAPRVKGQEKTLKSPEWLWAPGCSIWRFRRPETVQTYSPRDQENSPASRFPERQTSPLPPAHRFLRSLLPSYRSLSPASSIRTHSCLSQGAVHLRVASGDHRGYLPFESASSRSAGLSVS